MAALLWFVALYEERRAIGKSNTADNNAKEILRIMLADLFKGSRLY